MSQIDLHADCARCAALCCVAFHFDRSDQFALHKAAGEPCLHLDDTARCRIHENRACHGFRGCIQYDCHGAGQRVTQDLFAGRSWLSDRSLLVPMVTAFLVVQRAHRLLVVLREAERLELSASHKKRAQALELEVRRGEASDSDITRLEGEARKFLQSLRGCVTGRE